MMHCVPSSVCKKQWLGFLKGTDLQMQHLHPPAQELKEEEKDQVSVRAQVDSVL